jgi:hypothetical protein
VASVSRLIGYLDTTAKRHRVQEAQRELKLWNSRAGDPAPAQTHERRSRGAAFRISLLILTLVTGCWSLASQHLYLVGGCSTVPGAGFPGRFSLFKGRIVGGGSCRVSAFLGAVWISLSSRFITGTLYIAIGVPNGETFIINAFQ